MRRFFGSTGSVNRITVESRALKNNLLADPSVRVVDIYLPAGHDGEGLPLLVDLVGFTGSGLSHTNWVGFRENLPERLDRLIGEQKMPPVVVAFPDCFTRLGGNQYINSAATGAWEDFLLHEMLPAIEQRYGCGGTGRRGVFGKSSGGYGALTHALRHSDVWAAAACRSGDMGFELCYLPDMPAVLRALAGTENSIERWWQQLEAAKKHPEGSGKVINALAMAASYDPDPRQFLGIRLPVTIDTCELIDERWANWSRQDPVIAIESQADNLRRLKALYIGVRRDQRFEDARIEACPRYWAPTPICPAYDGGATRGRASRRLHASQSDLYQCGLGYNVAGAGSAKRHYLRRQPPPEAVAGQGTAHMRPGAAIRRPSLNG